MSNTSDNNNTAGQTDPAVQSGSGGSKPSEKKKPGLPTIEEHAANLNVDAPVFAAVMQSEQWASGKRVPEAVFKKAVETFLGAPMGGA